MASFEPTAEDRVAALDEEAQALRGAGEAVLAATWESEAVPDDMAELAARLQEVPDAVERLRESAARSGAEMALTMIMSWHNSGFDPAGLARMTHGFRQGTSFADLQARPGVREAAARMGDYADLNVFFLGKREAGGGDVEVPEASSAEEPEAAVAPTALVVATEQAVDLYAPRVE